MAKKTRGKGWELIRARAEPQQTRREESADPAAQRIRVREEKRARGKMVTVARGFLLTDGDLKALGKKLKSACGSGGTVTPAGAADEGASIEIQGRQSDKLCALLEQAGYRVQR